MLTVITNDISKNPSILENPNYNNDEKEKIIAYLRSFSPVSIAGKVYDYTSHTLTSIDNLEYEYDGFYWTDQDIYHIERYNATVSDAFLEFLLNK